MAFEKHLAYLSERYGLEITEKDNIKLYDAIDGWLGVKHVLGGCSKSGVDCSCFVGTIYKQVYHKTLKRRAIDMYKKDVNKIRKGRLDEGDLVFFKIGNKQVSHVGIYLKNNKFVHASTTRGVTVSDLNSDYYRKRFAKGGKVKL